MKIFNLYVITNLVNNKQYIGITSQSPDIRWSEHLRAKKGCNGLIRAFNKHGRENFQFQVIYQTKDIDDLNEKEIIFIQKYNTLAPNGYNLVTGGKFYTKSEEAIKNLSAALKGVDRSNLKKPLLRINKDNFEIFEYDSLKSACLDGFDSRSIRACIKNERSNITHYGYYWCYKKDYDKFEFKPIGRYHRQVKSVDLTSNEVKIYNSVKEAIADGNSFQLFKALKGRNPSYKNKIWSYI